MIIRNEKRSSLFRPRIVLPLAAVGVAVAIALFFWRSHHLSPNMAYFCDMEEVRDNEHGSVFVGKGIEFRNGASRDSTHSLSGKYSSKGDKDREFAANFEIDDVRPGEMFEGRVWVLSESPKAVLIADGAWGPYVKGEYTGEEAPGGWKEVKVQITAAQNLSGTKLKIYCWNPSDMPAWFDDMTVQRIMPGSHGVLPSSDFNRDSLRVVNLIVGEKGWAKLQQKRDEALRAGILKSADDDWVKVKLEEGKLQYQGEMRLKGDWTDHLQGDKWSYRVELAPGSAWNRLVTFSFQNPETRHNLSEWVYHQLLKKEDILTPRYDFVELKINNISKGLYAYEEHFLKQIPEYNHRREGPIMKFDEAGFWNTIDRELSSNHVPLEDITPYYNASDIIAFKEGKTLKDSTLRRQFMQASTLMKGYKDRTMPLDQVFDVDRVARYFAIVDLCRTHHGIIWHNQRWYYNPVISRLEPIGFDGYTQTGPFEWIKRPFLGWSLTPRFNELGDHRAPFTTMFENPEMVAKYVQELNRITSPEYIKSFLSSIQEDLTEREEWIKVYNPWYKYNTKFIYNNAAKIRAAMYPLDEVSAKAFFQGEKNGKFHYKVSNFHGLPIEILGIGKKADKMEFQLAQPLYLNAYTENLPEDWTEITMEGPGKVIFFRVPGIDSLFTQPILQWALPAEITPEQELFRDLTIASNDIYTVDEDKKLVRFAEGKYQTSENILIPPGYTVTFEQGVQLDLIKKAMFISKSQVLMLGTADNPILIHSSDNSARGFTVLQAPRKSIVQFTAFDGLNTMEHKGWNITGAVTFYECEVLLENDRFVNNHCEDALNLVRCVFQMNDCYVAHTFADGFDADFCNGVMRRCNFYKTGNDGMDFSGSTITIFDCNVESAGDKGISLGEESTIEVISAVVRNSVIGLAAKDLTEVEIKNITLEGNKQAFAAYQKKPEYGPAHIRVKKYSEKDNGQLYVLQAGSTLELGDEKIVGKR